ncbi:MAG: M14 family zinc carboxypeptidase [bacterium]|nr:M14 family zinc carboxypeptidase [bacterium]
MSKVFFTIILLILIHSYSAGQDAFVNEKYSQFRIHSDNSGAAEKIMKAGLLIDHAVRKPHYTDAWLSHQEIEMLKKSGVSYTVLVADWKRFYDELPKMTSRELTDAMNNSKDAYNVSHSIYGTMGGFLKYSEVNAKLDSMRLQYPNLISTKFSLDTTLQGRNIWTVRVSNNPDVVTGRPEVWYHSLIHAREPQSMEHMIYYMYWLFENYNIDPIATYILNNRELYFTPVLNPDGYVYNETTNPGGGGMWRKNRRNNGSSFGVDLNRNYGTFQFWNSINNGSSTTASSDTYRGLSPFSELETRGVMNFVNSRNLQAVLGSHTYGNYIIKPWAWQDPVPTPDNAAFNEYLADMTKYNHYLTGTPFETVGYKVRGSADDWYYNDSSHSPHKIFAMTPESGLTGFWPTQAEIIPLAQEMLFTNQYIAMIAGAYVYSLSNDLNNVSYLPGESGTLKIKFKNKGRTTANNVKIECTTSAYYLNVPITFYNYSSLNSFQSDSATFGFTIAPAAPKNSAIPVTIKFKQNDSDVVYHETKYILTDNGSLTLADSAKTGFGNWTSNAGWNVTSTQSHSPTQSFTDSPSGLYANNANNSMTLNAPVNVSAMPVTYLNFWHRYDLETGYDFGNVEVSSNNGSTWQTVTNYNGTSTTWTQQSLEITSFANGATQLKIRFRLKSDGGVTADGWYVDDIRITNYSLLNGSITTPVNITAAPEAFYNAGTNSLNIRDTFSVKLRSVNAPYAIVDSARSVIDSLTLTGNFGFKNAPTANYYITVNHRNSIETWSKAGGESYTFGTPLNYNFTSSSSQAFGSNMKLISGKYFIFSGDVNQDGNVDAKDLVSIYNDQVNFVTGYVATDVNADYVTDVSDLIITYNNTVNFVSKITP